MSNIRSLVENKSKLDYKELTLSLVQEFGIKDKVEWDSVIPARVQKELFGGETLRLFKDHETFANQKDIRAIHRSKGETSQLLILSAILNDEKLSKQTIERITKKFVGGQAAERYVVWFFGNPQHSAFKVVLSGKEGKKVVLKTLPFAVDQPYYKTYDFILNEVSSKVNKFFVEPNELWKSLWKAFDISVVNKKFYLDIKSAFDSLVNDDLFKGSIRIEEARKQFAVRLIGRIIFSWFLKKKGIISNDVLSSNAVRKYDNYYLELLEKLFFGVFNTPQNERSKIPELVKEYPFLNGGLFEVQIGDYGDYQGKVFIDNDWFFGLFSNTLEKYNFTIDENTSSNSEIAIDPEMLGRIFENLLAEQNPETKESARKSTGSYYTPREIVDYMVEQSLKEYLKSNFSLPSQGGEHKRGFEATIEDFVHTEELPEELKPYSNEILDKLNSVKILDPACGSGAFPIGMLQKIIALKLQLSPLAKGGTQGGSKEVYNLKLQTILNSIYGCDIQPMAVELSRLRCWLSLIIDEPVDKKKINWGIANLPNLDFKFVCVNTLIGLPEFSASFGISEDEFNKLKSLREEYFTASAKRKEKIEVEFKIEQKKIAEKHAEWSTKNTEAVTMLTNWNPFDISETPWFDPFWMFGIKNGFNVVIGNPPYISNRDMHRLGLKELIKIYNRTYKSSKSGNYDLYVIFIEKSLLLLAREGILSFIVPNKFIIAKYSHSLLRFINESFHFNSVNDFSISNVFENAAVYPIVIIISRSDLRNRITNRNYMEYLPDVSTVKSVEWDYLNHSPTNRGTSVKDKILSKIEECISVNSKLSYAPGINGFQFKNYSSCVTEGKQQDNSRRLVVTGTIDKYSLLKNLTKFRGKKYHNPFINYNPDIISDGKWELFCTPKILVAGMTKKIEAILDEFGEYAPAVSVYCIISSPSLLKYTLGILNSQLIDWYFKVRFEDKHLAGGYISINSQLLKKIPIVLSEEHFNDIIRIVEKIMIEKKNNPDIVTQEENDLDIMVYKLYKLTFEEIKIIDPEIEKIISKEEYERKENL